jgi:hypothetical protein
MGLISKTAMIPFLFSIVPFTFQIKVDKKWKKNIFDKQWKKTKPNKGELASKRREAGDRVSANQVAAISHLDVVPVYNPTRLYPAVVSSSADSGPVMLTPFSLADNNVSRITIGS